MRLDTQLLHAGEGRPIEGAVNFPIFQTVNYRTASPSDEPGSQSNHNIPYHSIPYLRLNNSPQHLLLHRRLAILEGGEDALVTASGMAAISTALFSLLKPGDHLITASCLYGGTQSLIDHELADFGISSSVVDALQPEQWETALRPQTRVFYLESLSNPLQQVPALTEIVEFCRRHQILAVIDNTLATPVNLRPLELGFDLVLHSATKFLNGHSDIAAGVIVGSSSLIEPIKRRADHLGGNLDPNSMFLLLRGLKTLGLRVRHQNTTALSLAQWLTRQPQVDKVYYAGLESSQPDHRQHHRHFRGFGGVLSFELRQSPQDFLNRLQLPLVAASLGGVESLICLPCQTSHAGLTPEQRASIGISDRLIRLSVGLEDLEDLQEDFLQALSPSA